MATEAAACRGLPTLPGWTEVRGKGLPGDRAPQAAGGTAPTGVEDKKLCRREQGLAWGQSADSSGTSVSDVWTVGRSRVVDLAGPSGVQLPGGSLNFVEGFEGGSVMDGGRGLPRPCTVERLGVSLALVAFGWWCFLLCDGETGVSLGSGRWSVLVPRASDPALTQ